MIRFCKTCETFKRVDQFKSGRHECRVCNRQYNREYRKNNLDRVREHARNWVHNHKDQASASNLKYRSSPEGKDRNRRRKIARNYGLTLEQWDNLFASQGNSCAICGRNEKTGKGWHTDHCHITGRVRGILCSCCNKGIGMLQDSVAILKKAQTYLEVFEKGLQ